MRAPSTAAARSGRIVGVDGFQEGQKIWVEQADGTQRAAIYVGEGELSSWFGGSPGVYVVYQDTRSSEEVSAVRVIPREDEPAF